MDNDGEKTWSARVTYLPRNGGKMVFYQAWLLNGELETAQNYILNTLKFQLNLEENLLSKNWTRSEGGYYTQIWDDLKGRLYSIKLEAKEILKV